MMGAVASDGGYWQSIEETVVVISRKMMYSFIAEGNKMRRKCEYGDVSLPGYLLIREGGEGCLGEGLQKRRDAG